MTRCVINFARGGWYRRGQSRLVDSLTKTGFVWPNEFLGFEDEEVIGAPAHEQCPYGFKPHAIEWARVSGFDLALWCDASVFAIRDIRPLFDWILTHGHAFFYNTNCGPFCSDACLNTFGVTREQSFDIPMLAGLCMAFDLRNKRTLEFLSRWLAAARDGVTFQGAHDNQNNAVSTDPRVKGHRHDQSAASLIAHQLCMPLISGPDTFFQYYENPTKTSWAENRDLSLIGPRVVLVAQGM